MDRLPVCGASHLRVEAVFLVCLNVRYHVDPLNSEIARGARAQSNLRGYPSAGGNDKGPPEENKAEREEVEEKVPLGLA